MKKRVNLKLLIGVGAVLVVLAVSMKSLWLPQKTLLTGTLELTEHSLGARVPGRLVKLSVDEGSTVSKGEVIATLDRYDQAKHDYERASEIYRQGGLDHQALEQAQLALEDQQVVSPVDGVVLIKVREAGEVLSAGSPVVVVGDRSSIWVKVYVVEGLINRVHIGQEATVHLDGLKKTYQGHVSFIADKAEFTPRNVQTPEERVTQTFGVKVTIDAPDPALRPGVAADVDLEP